MTLSGLPGVPSLSEVTPRGVTGGVNAGARVASPPNLEVIPGEYHLPLLGPILKGLSAPGEAAGAEQSKAQKPLEEIVANPLSALTGWPADVGKLIAAYGIRLLEVIAGLGLIIFGLSTLAHGGQAPNVVPVPV